MRNLCLTIKSLREAIRRIIWTLTHSTREYFEKLALKKKIKKRNFKRFYLKS